MPDTVVRVGFEFRNTLKDFFKCKDMQIVLGGPAGTGKTRCILERQHLLMCKYPRARGLMVRKYRSSMNETCLSTFKLDVMADKQGTPYKDAPVWRERDQKFVYENGSEIIVGGMDDPSKIMSSFYDWFYWNEAIEAKRSEWEAVMSRLRNFVIPYQQAIGDTNPGPPTHWIKQYAEDKKLTFINTTHKDNPVYWEEKVIKKKNGKVINLSKWTEKGEIYVNNILKEGLSGLIRQRLYEGLWVLAEGQVYDEFDQEIHLIPWRELPTNWPHYWGFDFGFVDPFVWQDWAEDPETGALYLCRELYHSHLRVEEACRIIRQAGWTVPPMALICDHDSENRATMEKEFGMLTLPAYKAILPGIEAVKKRLPNNRHTGKPQLFIMENASILTDPKLKERHQPLCTASEIANYVWDTKKISLDKYKDMPIDKYNHGMDTMRYVVAFVDNVAEDPHGFQVMTTAHELVDDWDEEIYRMHNQISPF